MTFSTALEAGLTMHHIPCYLCVPEESLSDPGMEIKKQTNKQNHQAGLELRNPPASASRVLGLKASATMPSLFLVFQDRVARHLCAALAVL